MVEIKQTLQAIDDIARIAEYIAKDSLTYAKVQTLRFFRSVEILQSKPRAGRIVPEINNPQFR